MIDCAVIWAAIERLPQFAPLVTAGAAVCGAYVAWDGLNRWRREGIGKRRAELAEDVLAGAYQFQAVIRQVRLPVAHGGEGATRPRVEYEAADETQNKNSFFVPLERLASHQEFIATLFAKRFRMKALYGDAADAPFNAMNKAISQIRFAASQLIQHGTNPTMLQRHRERIEAWEETIWGDDGDDFDKKVQEAVRQIEELCKNEVQLRTGQRKSPLRRKENIGV